ncbi:ragulator complex protein LAMTOR1-like [Tubulanus polymorphus]|uniref:ragulator complex protein LAMTOR1-like n=1 Tax=Tubulanus polymorphus TaxID=672921 RepID=UPI003DA45582
MGCCFSSDDDKSSQEQDPDETTRLLRNPVSDADQSRSMFSDSNSSPHYQATQKGDEASTLSRILLQTANNVIDVSAIDTHNLEQQEYFDRVKHYKTRVEMICSNSHRMRSTSTLPNAGAPPHVILSAPPVSLTDIQFITVAAEKASNALKDVKVHHIVDLVVPFGVP